MLAGSEGIGGVEFDDARLTQTLGTIGLVLILFEGGLDRRLARDPTGDRAGDRPRDARHLPHRDGDRPGGDLDLRPQHPAGADPRLGGRRHRLGGDLRRAAQLAPRAAPGADAGGRVGDERPGRPAAGRRLRRMARRPLLRRPRHGRTPRREARPRRRLRAAARLGGPARDLADRAAHPGPLPGRHRGDRGALLRDRREPRRLGLPRRLRRGAGPRQRLAARAQHRRLLPPGTRLAGTDRSLLRPRPARLPGPAARHRRQGPAALGGPDRPRPPARGRDLHPARPLQPPRADDAQLGRSARRDPHLARHVPGGRRGRRSRA